MVRVTEVRYISGFTLAVRFNDGVQGEVDLSAELEGPIFAPLRDPSVFRAAALHPELHTVTWPNGADFAPEFLHQRIRVPA
jgi:hypothetical protein